MNHKDIFSEVSNDINRRKLDQIQSQRERIQEEYLLYKKSLPESGVLIVILDKIIYNIQADTILDHLLDQHVIFDYMFKLGITDINPSFVPRNNRPTQTYVDSIDTSISHHENAHAGFSISRNNTIPHSPMRDMLGSFFCDLIYSQSSAEKIRLLYQQYYRMQLSPSTELQHILTYSPYQELLSLYQSIRKHSYKLPEINKDLCDLFQGLMRDNESYINTFYHSSKNLPHGTPYNFEAWEELDHYIIARLGQKKRNSYYRYYEIINTQHEIDSKEYDVIGCFQVEWTLYQLCIQLLDEEDDKSYLEDVVYIFGLPYDDIFVKSLYQLVSTQRFQTIIKHLSSSNQQSDRNFLIDIYASFHKIKTNTPSSRPYIDTFFDSS